MRNRTLDYVFSQILWLLGSATQLIAAMGIGLKWVFMTFRCITFAIMDLAYFVPHVVWYLTSPNIIRRVSYRSSHTTKLRNLEALLSQNVMQESAPASGISLSWKRKKSAQNREASPAPTVTEGPDGVDYEAVERFARTINPADGTFVNGLPVDITDEANPATSFFPGATNVKNSFDDTLAALQRIYRHRSQQQQHSTKSKSPLQSENNSSFHEVEATNSAASNGPTPPEEESFTDSENDDDDDVEDRMNLHNRATLDIYLPIPLDTLFRFMDQERKSSESYERSRAASSHAPSTKQDVQNKKKGDGHNKKDDVRHRTKLTRKKFPVLISVNGGAWIVGCYLWNFLVARLFAARGYVVFCPDYRNFPQTTMEGMTLDVSDAVAWVLNNAERYNGDLGNVTLIGQSAGAHLTMMSLLSQAQQCAYRYNQEKGLYQDVPAPSKVAYNVPRYNPRESIHRYVGLSGIYNLSGLLKHFNDRGLYRDVLHQIAGGKSNMARYTLNAYFDDRQCARTGEVLPDNIFDYFPQRMFFVHGDADKSAPVTESANIVYLMRSAQRDAIVKLIRENPEAAKALPRPVTFEYILVPGATHTDSIIEEPLCGNSHIVEFLCYYDLDNDEMRHAQLTGKSSGGAAPDNHSHSRTSSVLLSNADSSEVSVAKMMEPDALSSGMSPVLSNLSKSAQYQFPVLPVARPDGILLSPCPSSKRRRLMRLASFVCPF
ncbi:ecotin [Lotmaria passim]